MTGQGPVSRVKEYLRQFSAVGADMIDVVDDGSGEVALCASDLQALIFAAESVAREQRAHWVNQYTVEDADRDAAELAIEEFRAVGAVQPFLSVVSAALPHPLDVEIPDPVAFVLVAKGWTPPESDQYCPRRMSAPTRHDFLPYTRTCLHCGAHEKATTR